MIAAAYRVEACVATTGNGWLLFNNREAALSAADKNITGIESLDKIVLRVSVVSVQKERRNRLEYYRVTFLPKEYLVGILSDGVTSVHAIVDENNKVLASIREIELLLSQPTFCGSPSTLEGESGYVVGRILYNRDGPPVLSVTDWPSRDPLRTLR
ncbi:MAG TPA: hypothetical protein VGN82_08995 [Bosea sp. (in: a-proteobacteria)]|jgi:hypothetical protein|uniref:hypothetical protein n=1 Tax=Bosea sp. (in: a-proteobacteria) TaxID=1871050 RepID=UPI002E0FF5F5|nr:hypothetical protein [Bosea sp. (in: a-proteobacteria)]